MPRGAAWYYFLVAASATVRRFDVASYFPIPSAEDMAAKDAVPRITYYASKLPDKDTWFQTDEGYRIYKNVPIARTGSQEYLGREIKKNPGYDSMWDIKDDEIVTVWRPLEEVTAAETLASFEGKSTLDEHPPDPQVLIDALDEYDSVSMGHVTNVRVGETLEDGDTSIVADLWVKHPDLIVRLTAGFVMYPVAILSCWTRIRLADTL